MLLLIIFLIFTFVLFLIYLIPVGPLSDLYIINKTAENFNLNKKQLSSTNLVDQLLSSTLAQSRDVPVGSFSAVIDKPKIYILANIYNVSQITNITKPYQTPTVLNEPFEIFLSAVSMAQEKNIPYFYLFSLYSFGEKKFLAFSNQPIDDGYSSVNIYPWSSLQYVKLLSMIGPANKRGYFNYQNFE